MSLRVPVWLARPLLLVAALLMLVVFVFSIQQVDGPDYSGLAVRPMWLGVVELSVALALLVTWLRLGGPHEGG